MSDSNATSIGTLLCELCRQGKSLDAIKELYADDVVSVEAQAAPGFEKETRGKEAVIQKATFWEANTEVHKNDVAGPFPHGEGKFAVIFNMDATMQGMGRHQLNEVAVYHVADGKIVREEFFYAGTNG